MRRAGGGRGGGRVEVGGGRVEVGGRGIWLGLGTGRVEPRRQMRARIFSSESFFRD